MNRMERRSFIKKAAISTVGGYIYPHDCTRVPFWERCASNKIQIGQIGFGRIARDHDVAETIKYDQAQFVAVCDVDSKRLADGEKTYRRLLRGKDREKLLFRREDIRRLSGSYYLIAKLTP